MGSFSQSSFHSPPRRDDAAAPMPVRPHEAKAGKQLRFTSIRKSWETDYRKSV